MPVPTQISDGHRIATIDHLSNSFIITDHEHHMIHKGNNYRAEVAEDVGSSNNISVSFKTPTGKQLHIEYSIRTENSAVFSLYEKSEVASGDALTARNSNRNYADSSETTNMVKNGTITTTNATTLVTHNVGYETTNPNNFDNGSASARHEWVLKENTVYTFELDNTAGASNEMLLRLDWYETEPETE